MTAILADTGPLYAAVDPDDAWHGRAVEDLRRLERTRARVLVAYPVLLEGYTLVLRRLGRQVAGDWLSDLIGSANWVNPDGRDYQAAAKTVAQYMDQPITLVDATLAQLASRMNAAVWTFDRHFDVLHARVWRH